MVRVRSEVSRCYFLYNSAVRQTKKVLIAGAAVFLCLGFFAVSSARRMPGAVRKISICDFRTQKAFDQNGKPIGYESDWKRELEFRPNAKRQVVFTVHQPPMVNRQYRIRFAGARGHSTGISPQWPYTTSTEVRVSSNFPITNNRDSVLVDLESTTGSWETVYEGKTGESNEAALWDLDQINGALLTVKNACPPDRQNEYTYRITTEPQMEKFRGNSPGADSTGRMFLFSREDAKTIKWVRVERSQYQTVFSGYLAFGTAGSKLNARESLSTPRFVGAFTGKQTQGSEANGVHYRRDDIGWDLDGNPVEVSEENFHMETLSTDGEKPSWIAFRIPKGQELTSYRLLDDHGSILDAESYSFDPGDGEGVYLVKSISGKNVKPAMNFVLQSANGDYRQEAETNRASPYDSKKPMEEGTFSIIKSIFKGKNYQTNVYAGFKLDPNRDYRLAVFDSKGNRLAAGGQMRGPTFSIGTMLGPNERETPVAKVVLESRPFSRYEFNNVPLTKPASLSQNRK